jgi:hypothetical protein
MLCSLSPLDNKKLEEIRMLENKTGKTLLAFSCHNVEPVTLSEGELGELMALEKRLGVILVAVK